MDNNLILKEISYNFYCPKKKKKIRLIHISNLNRKKNRVSCSKGNKAWPRNVLISCHFVNVIHPFVLSNSRLRFRIAATLTHCCPLIVFATEGIHCSREYICPSSRTSFPVVDWRIRLSPSRLRLIFHPVILHYLLGNHFCYFFFLLPIGLYKILIKKFG